MRNRAVVLIEGHTEHNRQGCCLPQTVLIHAVGHGDRATLCMMKAANWHLTEHEVERKVVLLVVADGVELVGSHADLFLVPVEEPASEEEERGRTKMD